MCRLAMVLFALLIGSVAFSDDRFIAVNSSDRPSGEFEIYVNNRSASDITISFELDLVNMKVNGGLKPAYVVPKGRHIQVIVGRKIRDAEKMV
ncbi:MAG: hypothetical protein P1V20_06155 [Verrucomicrobiales bacterium]|nr:hypothetical protein [Verrucomicrobiales bacterium]